MFEDPSKSPPGQVLRARARYRDIRSLAHSPPAPINHRVPYPERHCFPTPITSPLIIVCTEPSHHQVSAKIAASLTVLRENDPDCAPTSEWSSSIGWKRVLLIVQRVLQAYHISLYIPLVPSEQCRSYRPHWRKNTARVGEGCGFGHFKTVDVIVLLETMVATVNRRSISQIVPKATFATFQALPCLPTRRFRLRRKNTLVRRRSTPELSVSNFSGYSET